MSPQYASSQCTGAHQLRLQHWTTIAWRFGFNDLKPTTVDLLIVSLYLRILRLRHLVAAPKRQKLLKLCGFDMGRDYVAWATIRGNYRLGFHPHRHGIIYLPELGDTRRFGTSLFLWQSFFQVFIKYDLRPNAWAIERFTYRPGSQGLASEDINLRIPGMRGPSTLLVRNTEWKTWFMKAVHPDGAPSYFKLPTPHEGDAMGIAFYLAAVLLPRERRIRTQS